MKSHPTKGNGYVQIPTPLTIALDGNGPQRLNAQLCFSDFINIPNTAVNNQAGPIVLSSLLRQHIPKQGAAQRAAPVNNHHFSCTGICHMLLHQGIILVAFHSNNLATKRFPSTVIGEQRFNYPHYIGISVTQIRGNYVHFDTSHSRLYVVASLTILSWRYTLTFGLSPTSC